MVVRGRAGWTVAAAVVASVVVSGCGGGDSDKRASAPTSSITASPYSGGASATSSPSEQQSSTPSPTSRPAVDPLAPASIPPVVRNGKTPRPTVSSSSAPIRGSVRYSDGVTLRITRISQSTVKARGPGQLSGPVTTFALTLSNGSSRAVDLDQVVVTLVYGSPGRTARPIYLQGSQDFSGTAKPGASARATYTFGVPVAQRDRVVVHVDFDAIHTAAVFSGSAG